MENNLTKQTVLERPSSARPKPLALRESQESQQQMANLIFQCFQVLKLYGKEPEALESINAMFQFVLGDYPMEKISSAMSYYLKFSNEMPTPADIATIIERGNKPMFRESVYVTISKKKGEDRSGAEWEYLRDYERFITEGELE